MTGMSGVAFHFLRDQNVNVTHGGVVVLDCKKVQSVTHSIGIISDTTNDLLDKIFNYEAELGGDRQTSVTNVETLPPDFEVELLGNCDGIFDDVQVGVVTHGPSDIDRSIVAVHIPCRFDKVAGLEGRGAGGDGNAMDIFFSVKVGNFKAPTKDEWIHLSLRKVRTGRAIPLMKE